MTEEEIMIRAREARIKSCGVTSPKNLNSIRDGSRDKDSTGIRTAAQALRDVAKPLSEIRPADPDLIEARKLAAAAVQIAHPESPPYGIDSGNYDYDEAKGVPLALRAIKRGRELERQS